MKYFTFCLFLNFSLQHYPCLASCMDTEAHLEYELDFNCYKARGNFAFIYYFYIIYLYFLYYLLFLFNNYILLLYFLNLNK